MTLGCYVKPAFVLVLMLLGSFPGQAAEIVATSCIPHDALQRECIDNPASTKNWIYIVGPIVAGDYDRFKSVVTANPSANSVELRTPGGSVNEAFKIGRLIRSLYLNASAPWTSRTYCEREARTLRLREVPCTCASACFLILAGAVFRDGQEVYLHRIRFDGEFLGELSPEKARIVYNEGMDGVRRYLAEMDVPDKYYLQMLRVASSTVEKIDFVAGDFFLKTNAPLDEWLSARCGYEEDAKAKNRPNAACRSVSLDALRRQARADVLGVKNPGRVCLSSEGYIPCKDDIPIYKRQ